MTMARIKVKQSEYQTAVQSIDQLLAAYPKTPQAAAAWTLRGHAYFLAGNLFDSEESYIKALRSPTLPSQPNPKKDPILQERLALVYARRKAWRDAKVVFARCTRDFVSTTSWLGLG